MANADGDITLKIGVVADDARKVASELHKYMEKTLNKPFDTKAFDGIKKSITETAAKSEKLGEELRTLKSTGADLGFNEQFKQLSESASIAQKKYFALRREAKAMRQAGNIPGAEELEKQVAIADAQRRQLLSQRMTLANTGRSAVSDEFGEKTVQLTELNNQMVLYIKQLERMRSLEATRKQVASVMQSPEKATPKKGLSETEDKARVLMESIEQLRGKLEDADKSVGFLKMDKSIQKTIDDTNALKSTFEQMRAEVYKVTPTEEFAQASAKVKTLQQDVEKYHTKLMELEEMGKTHTQPYADTVFKWNQAQNSLITQLQLMRQMTAAGEDYNRVLWTETEEYNAAITKQQQLNRDLEIGKQRLKESAEYQAYVNKHVSTPQDIKAEGSEAEQTTRKLSELEGQKNRTKTANKQLGEESEETALKLRREKSAAELLRDTFSTFGRGVKGIGKGMATVARATGNFVNRLRGVNKETFETSQSLKSLLKFSLKYFLGLRSIFILYKRIRSAGIEAYKGLASQFPELQAEVNELKNSFFQLKNSLATMAQPILSYLVPAIKTLMGWLVSAMNALANFFAIFTGAKYIYKAANVNKDWAKSASGAGKAAKEASEDIAEYDNLILIQQDKDNGGGGSGAADDYAGAWEKVEAESDFAQKLKDAINREDWDGVGQLFADKLNTITKKADDWINNKLRPEGKKWATRIGKILGGLTDGWDSELTGKTITDGLMSVMDIVATFYETYPWKTLGTKIAGLINSAFTSWEPETVARFLSGKFNRVIQFFSGMLDEQSGINWKLVGTKIGESLKKTIENINWKELGADLSKLASGILTTLASFLESSKVGKTVGEAINRFLNGIDFAKLTTDLVTLAINIIDSIADAIGTVDWYAVGKAIGDILANIDWGKFLQSLTTLALNLLKGIGSAIAGLISNPAAIASLAEALVVIFAGKALWSKVFGATAVTGAAGSALSAVFAGTALTIPELFLVFESIKFLNDPMEYIENLREWLKHPFDKPEYIDKSDNLLKGSKKATPFGTKNLTENTSLDTYHQQMDEINSDIVTTKDAMEEAISSSLHYAEIAMHTAGVAIGETAKQTFDGVGASGSTTLHKLSTDAVDASGSIATQMETAKNKSIASFDGMETEFGNMSNGIKNSVATVPDSFEGTFTDAYTRVTNSFDQTRQFFGDVAEGVKSPFSTMADFFESTFSNSWNGVVDVFSTNTPEFKTIQDNISGSFKTVINGMITSVNNSITSPFQTLSNLISQMKNLDVGGTKIFSNLRNFVVPSIPKLAQGAVLPPNQPFLAMVGDQKQGTNVEAPLETIMEALRQVMQETNASNNQPIVLQLNGNQIAQAVWDEENKRYKQTGSRYR